MDIATAKQLYETPDLSPDRYREALGFMLKQVDMMTGMIDNEREHLLPNRDPVDADDVRKTRAWAQRIGEILKNGNKDHFIP